MTVGQRSRVSCGNGMHLIPQNSAHHTISSNILVGALSSGSPETRKLMTPEAWVSLPEGGRRRMVTPSNTCIAQQ